MLAHPLPRPRRVSRPQGCRTLVEDLFQGRWQSQVRCLGCGHESNTYESFVTLPLDILQVGGGSVTSVM